MLDWFNKSVVLLYIDKGRCDTLSPLDSSLYIHKTFLYNIMLCFINVTMVEALKAYVSKGGERGMPPPPLYHRTPTLDPLSLRDFKIGKILEIVS